MKRTVAIFMIMIVLILGVGTISSALAGGSIKDGPMKRAKINQFELAGGNIRDGGGSEPRSV